MCIYTATNQSSIISNYFFIVHVFGLLEASYCSIRSHSTCRYIYIFTSLISLYGENIVYHTISFQGFRWTSTMKSFAVAGLANQSPGDVGSAVVNLKLHPT